MSKNRTSFTAQQKSDIVRRHLTNKVAASTLAEELRVLGGECHSKKSQSGLLEGTWVPQNVRDAIVDYAKYWSKRTELPYNTLLDWARLKTSKYHQCIKRYEKVNAHIGKIPRDWWLKVGRKLEGSGRKRPLTSLQLLTSAKMG